MSTDILNDDGFVVVESPGFPDHYPSNLDQSWVFYANKGFRIELLIFELEDGYDYVYLGKGSDSNVTETTVYELSGSLEEGLEYFIDSQSMWLRITSDSSVQYQGFRINVNAFDTTSHG